MVKVYKARWRLVNTLILLFILGYAAFLAIGTFSSQLSGLESGIVSIVFIFGAVFVVIMLKESMAAIEELIRQKEFIFQKHREIELANKLLRIEQKRLKTRQGSISKRNRELQDALDELYSLKLQAKHSKKRWQ